MILRRCKQCRGLIYERDGLSVDPGCGSVTWKDQLLIGYISGPRKAVGLRMLAFLMLGRRLSTDELVQILYGDDESGGPDNARHVISATLCVLRRKVLARAPAVSIETVQGRGYQLQISEAA